MDLATTLHRSQLTLGRVLERAKLASAALAAAASVSITSAAAAAPPNVVTIDSGQVRGAVLGDVVSFKGIPFAAPPVGELRWRAPQPVKAWSGVRDAVAYGHDCMQIPFPSDAAPLGTTPSEDCLVMNVWRPATSARKLPVLVWIYGGGFVNGGSSPAVYDGAAFARQGLVFVSFNYRLGRFGFFAHPALTAAKEGPVGNFGLMDQEAALRWVKRNIAAFGGDPGQVTIFGESAGGGSVTSLMAAPAARGLFQRAAIMSGGGRGTLMGQPRHMRQDLPGLPSAETVGMNFARKHGLEATDAKALAALRALPAAAVAQGVGLAELFSGGEKGPPTSTGPFLDGITLVGTNEELFARGAMVKVPVMVGATSADIGFVPFKTKEELFAAFGADAAKARALYDPKRDMPFPPLAQKVGADIIMVEPARFVAEQVMLTGQPAWHYRFSYVARAMRAAWASGAPHASEIPYVFNTVAAKYGDTLTSQDAATARAANAYFGNFAKSGDPNGPGLPAWPKYDPANKPVLDLTLEHGPVGGADPWQARLDLVADHAATRNR